ncbi:hypothetical protein PG999_005413 [Apiospora kogelbergensis]|uniref:Uncharacterized protein n=1 Tax=Apiospora kogelbergensis TaxID=1337665 RepID=A0AAW0R249_9PEZI
MTLGAGTQQRRENMFINSETYFFALFYRFYFWACYSPSKGLGLLDYRLLYAESGKTVTRAKY